MEQATERLRALVESEPKFYLHGFDICADLRFLLAELARVEAERDEALKDSAWRGEKLQAVAARLARFEDMARRVKDFQSAEADLRELRSEVVDKNGWDDDYYKMALHHAEQRLEAAELALLALQTETHDGK